MQQIPFVKMHALGNSCVILHDSTESYDISAGFCTRILSPHHGIGADNLMVLRGYEGNAFSISGFNADGSPVGLCANGIRCVTWMVCSDLREQLKIPSTELTPESVLRFNLDGVLVSGRVLDQTEKIVEVTISPPKFFAEEIPFLGTATSGELEVHGEQLSYSLVNVGNPHCVFFMEELPSPEKLAEIGSSVEENPLFPERTNVEFVSVLDQNSIGCRIWERGVGITSSSGSGASASAVTAIQRALVQSPVRVEMPGGTITVHWHKGNDIQVSAPCTPVSSGVYFLDQEDRS